MEKKRRPSHAFQMRLSVLSKREATEHTLTNFPIKICPSVLKPRVHRMMNPDLQVSEAAESL
jgi:hypothetical protein